MRLPLTLSVAGHAACLALLVFLMSGRVLPVTGPIAKRGIEVVFRPALPKSEATPMLPPTPEQETPPPPLADEPPPAEQQVATVPPPPESPAVVSEPAPPAPEAPAAARTPTPSPPAHKPIARIPPKPVHRQEKPPQPSQAYLLAPRAPPAPPVPRAPPAAPVPRAPAAAPAPSVAAARPAPLPSPEASTGYRALLSAWLESHKRYPDAARQRGEEGNAVLRFAVDRSGRVIDFAVTKSSGYSDLDESIEQMMQGATLPPFPAGMPQLRMEWAVTIRFSLRR